MTKLDLQPLLDNLKAENSEDRQLAIKALADTNEPDAVAPVFGMLDDDDPNVRHVSMWALTTKFSCPEVYEYLVKAILYHRRSCAQLPSALAKHGEKAIPHICKMALDVESNSDLRVEAFECMMGLSGSADPATAFENIAKALRKHAPAA